MNGSNSLSYNKAWTESNWQTTFAWGRNWLRPGRAFNGALLESAIEIRDRHVLFGRAEYVQKEEFNGDVGKLDLGYIWQFRLIPYTLWGLGALGSASFYKDVPLSYMVFLRIDLKEIVKKAGHHLRQ
jgi:hypothetical protein